MNRVRNYISNFNLERKRVRMGRGYSLKERIYVFSGASLKKIVQFAFICLFIFKSSFKFNWMEI